MTVQILSVCPCVYVRKMGGPFTFLFYQVHPIDQHIALMHPFHHRPQPVAEPPLSAHVRGLPHPPLIPTSQ